MPGNLRISFLLGKVQKLTWYFGQPAYRLCGHAKFDQVAIFVDGVTVFIGFRLTHGDRQMADGAKRNSKRRTRVVHLGPSGTNFAGIATSIYRTPRLVCPVAYKEINFLPLHNKVEAQAVVARRPCPTLSVRYAES